MGLDQIDWQQVGFIYLCGIPVWCFVIGLGGGKADLDFVISAVLWPLLACAMLGRIVGSFLP